MERSPFMDVPPRMTFLHVHTQQTRLALRPRPGLHKRGAPGLAAPEGQHPEPWALWVRGSPRGRPAASSRRAATAPTGFQCSPPHRCIVDRCRSAATPYPLWHDGLCLLQPPCKGLGRLCPTDRDVKRREVAAKPARHTKELPCNIAQSEKNLPTWLSRVGSNLSPARDAMHISSSALSYPPLVRTLHISLDRKKEERRQRALGGDHA